MRLFVHRVAHDVDICIEESSYVKNQNIFLNLLYFLKKSKGFIGILEKVVIQSFFNLNSQ